MVKNPQVDIRIINKLKIGLKKCIMGYTCYGESLKDVAY